MRASAGKGSSTRKCNTIPGLRARKGKIIEQMSVEGLLPQHIRNLISTTLSYLDGVSSSLIRMTVSKDIEAMAAVLTTYQDALNASNTDQVLSLYTSDGVFMPQYSSASVGTEEVRHAYDQIFSSITLQIRVNVEEIVPTNANWAFARTTSVGTATTKSGEVREEANQELFVFQNVDDEWRIARYCFCTTNPA